MFDTAAQLIPLADVVVGPPYPAWSIGGMLIAVVVIAAACALVAVALRQFNVQIPQWVIHCVWIVLVAAVVIFAIRVVFSL